MIIFGYKPLFLLPAPVFFPVEKDNVSDIVYKWEKHPTPAFYGLAWVDPNTVAIIIDNHKKIFEHITLWSENNPQEWFTFDISFFWWWVCILFNA